MKRAVWMLMLVLVASGPAGCGKKDKADEKADAPRGSLYHAGTDSTLLRAYPMDRLDGVITQNGIAVDSKTSTDGRGSVMVTTETPATFQLYETGDIDIENARLIYRAKLRTFGVEGKVYLEMWCSFAGLGEAYARALDTPLSGTTDWSSQETTFFLKPGENPRNIRLNLVVEGRGKVWIDDMRLEKGPPAPANL